MTDPKPKREAFDTVNPAAPPAMIAVRGRGRKLPPYKDAKARGLLTGRRQVTMWRVADDDSFLMEFRTGRHKQRLRLSTEALRAVCELYDRHLGDDADGWKVICRYVVKTKDGEPARAEAE